MTTPTDPTTLRTALDALRYLSDAATNILNTKTADPLFPVRVVDLSRANADAQDVIIAALATPAPAADYPGPKPFPPGCICGTDNLTDDCTAHPAPAADEARCGFMWSVDGRACGRPEDDERHTEDAFLFHPFQPAPTPAPPTPPATEERALCRNPECRWQGQGPHWEDATPLDFGPPPPPPATEPVAALVEAFMLALVDDRYGLSRYGAHAKNVQTVAEVRARLDAIVAAAEADTLRSRLDTEQTISSNYADSLALMVKDHDTLRSRVAALEEAVATFLSIAYPSGTGHPADRAADDLRLALAPTPDR